MRVVIYRPDMFVVPVWGQFQGPILVLVPRKCCVLAPVWYLQNSKLAFYGTWILELANTANQSFHSMDSNSLCIQVLIFFISRPASITFFHKVACSLVILLIHLSYALVAGALNFPKFCFPVSRCSHWPITQNKNKSLQTLGHLKVKKHLHSIWPCLSFKSETTQI
jgi:hypothetical protein